MAGRVVYKTLEDPWTGSESDKFILLGYLDQLRKDSALLSSEAVLPDLTDELAPVSMWPGEWVPGGLVSSQDEQRFNSSTVSGEEFSRHGSGARS